MPLQIPFLSYAAGILALLLGRYVLVKFSESKSLPLPPGPKTRWSFNNNSALDGAVHPWITYFNWKKTYGDIVYTRRNGASILVLNSASVVSDLLEKRSAIYSSRPVRTMVVELMGWDFLFSAMVYGTWWKRHRVLFQKYFSPTGGEAHYNDIQLTETHEFLRGLLENPTDFRHLLRRLAAAIILKVTYGIHVNEEVVDGHNYISLANAALEGLGAAGIFGTYLVDYFPILKHVPSWMPGASFKRQARQWHKVTRELVRRPFDLVGLKLQRGTATPCLVTQELENILPDSDQEKVLQNVAATAYAAGSDTVVSVMLSFFLAMALFPEIQDKAQKELDAVLGGRLPTHADRAQLPFITCICYEVLRWIPVTNLAVAHYASEDDEYRGYRIPKGTTVLPNAWAILHDPDYYPDPLSFDPARFLHTQRNIAEGINQIPDGASFGFGRRICPGRGFAMDTIWIVMASMLSVYKISEAVDESGKSIESVDAFSPPYTPGLISHPLPFQCTIVPRNTATKAVINQTLDEQA